MFKSVLIQLGITELVLYNVSSTWYSFDVYDNMAPQHKIYDIT